MAANEIHVNDVGTVFEMTIKDDGVAVDVSLASLKNLIFWRADGTGTRLNKSATFTTDGTDGKIQYTSVASELTLGVWEWQGYIELGSGKWHTDISSFTVYRNI